jgi:hypothetical protein
MWTFYFPSCSKNSLDVSHSWGFQRWVMSTMLSSADIRVLKGFTQRILLKYGWLKYEPN